MRAAGLVLAVLGLGLWPGCRKDEPSPENDRTIARLKEEADRQAEARAPPSGGPLAQGQKQTPEAVNDALAQLAAQGAEKQKSADAPPKLALPEGNATVHVGTAAVKLTGLSAAHTASGPRLSLSTEGLFLRVELAVQNVGKAPSKLDFAFAQVKDAQGGEHAVARDAQRLAGTRELSLELPPGERHDLVLYFEVPPEGPGRGWSLSLPAGVGGEQDVSLPLG